MAGSLIIAHDLGTSGNKATLYTTGGQLINSVVSSYNMQVFKDGWAEQDPEDWWNAVCDSTRLLMQGRPTSDVAGISFSGQMLGCLCIDKTGRPLMNSIIWADMRAKEENDFLEEKIGFENVCKMTGLRPAPNYTLQKLMWLKKSKPDIYKNTWRVLQAKDYIVYRMTGTVGTDITDAAMTQALDIKELEWADKMIDATGIRREIFPDIKESGSVAGYLNKTAAEEMGLEFGIPVIVGAGDGLCATVGAGSVEPGIGHCCLGSSSWVSNCTRKLINNVKGTLMYNPHVVKNMYCLTGTMQTGGLAYNWVKKQYFPEKSYEELNRIAADIDIGSNGIVFLPYLMGERAPWWDADAKGVFLGLGLNSTKEDMLRAVLEGVALNLTLIFREIHDFEPVKEINIIGGGAKGEIWPQMLADMFNVPVYKLASAEEGSSFGAAVIAGVALGIYSDYSVVNELIVREGVYMPDKERHSLYMEKLGVFEQTYLALRSIFRKIG